MDAIFEEGDIQLRSEANFDRAEDDTVLHEKELIEVDSTDITLTWNQGQENVGTVFLIKDLSWIFELKRRGLFILEVR